MALILSLETSTSVCSVALHEDGKLIACSEVFIQQAHAAKLALLVRQLIDSANINASQINAIAVSSGPGSYTGLRIGTSTAKGLSYALNIPLISVNSLLSMAHKVTPYYGTEWLCPMIDARRMEVYLMVTDTNFNIVLPTQALVIDQDSFADILASRKLIFFGNGAEKCEGIITSENAIFLKNVYPSASAIGELAFIKYEKGEVEDLLTFEPFYLKEFLIKEPGKASAK